MKLFLTMISKAQAQVRRRRKFVLSVCKSSGEEERVLPFNLPSTDVAVCVNSLA